VDAALAVWVVGWLVVAVTVYSSVRQLEELGGTVVTAGEGLDETSRALVRASRGLRQTGAAFDDIPFVGDTIGREITRAANDVDTISGHVAQTAKEAHTAGEDVRGSASGLAWALGAAVALVPTLPIVFLYLLVRPLVGQRLREK
jgi:hypothetical protein